MDEQFITFYLFYRKLNLFFRNSIIINKKHPSNARMLLTNLNNMDEYELSKKTSGEIENDGM